MKLKTRLIIAFFVIICVPLLLAGVSLVGFSTYQIRNLEDHLGISGVTYENMSDSVQVLNKATNSNFEQIKAKGSENPDAFLNRDYLDQLKPLCEKYNCTPADINMAWILAQDEKVVLLSGASKVKNIIKNVRCTEVELSAEDVALIRDMAEALDK